MTDKHEIEILSGIVRKAIDDRNRAAALQFLYCAAENMAGTISVKETIQELRKIAQHLEDFG